MESAPCLPWPGVAEVSKPWKTPSHITHNEFSKAMLQHRSPGYDALGLNVSYKGKRGKIDVYVHVHI